MNSTSRILGFATFLVIATATSAYAQQPQAIRGTIDKIDGGIVSIKQANGADADVKLLDNAKVFRGCRRQPSPDVKPNDFIGVGAMPQPDGSQPEGDPVTIFAESQRGTGEGFGASGSPRRDDDQRDGREHRRERQTVRSVMVKYTGRRAKDYHRPRRNHQLSMSPAPETNSNPALSVSVVRPEKRPMARRCKPRASTSASAIWCRNRIVIKPTACAFRFLRQPSRPKPLEKRT